MAAKGNSVKSKEPGAIAKLYLRAYNFSLVLGYRRCGKCSKKFMGCRWTVCNNIPKCRCVGDYACGNRIGTVQSCDHNFPSAKSSDGGLWSFASDSTGLCSCFSWFAYSFACVVCHRDNTIFVLFHELNGLCAPLHCLAQIHDIHRTVSNWCHRRIVVLLLGSNVRERLSRCMELCSSERLEFHIQLSLFPHICDALVHTTFSTDVSAHVRSKTQNSRDAINEFHEQKSSVNISLMRRYLSRTLRGKISLIKHFVRLKCTRIFIQNNKLLDEGRGFHYTNIEFTTLLFIFFCIYLVNYTKLRLVTGGHRFNDVGVTGIGD